MTSVRKTINFLRQLIREFIKGLTTITREEKQILKMLGEPSVDDTEEFCCVACDKKISEEQYNEHGGLCRDCRGMPTQQGFPSPPGFPKV